MENMVVMALKDYNALKMKADAFGRAVSLQVFSTWVDCQVDPRALEPLVNAKIKEAIAYGEIDANNLQMKPTKEWFNSMTVANIIKDPEE